MSEVLRGREIGVLGLARSGLAAARLALAHGASVYASDAGDSPAASAAAEQVRALGGTADVGTHDAQRLSACDRIVVSPGIPPDAAILRHPAVAAVPRVAEVEFAWHLLGRSTIAITGTNGKTTVTALIAHLLATAGKDAPAAGNIGTALAEVALRDPAPDWVVVEVSSFQLADTQHFAPEVGVLTNLAPDHLDRYDSLQAYYADKARLFRNANAQSRWVLNGQDAAVMDLAQNVVGDRFLFRTDRPLDAAQCGGWLAEDGSLMLRLAHGADERLLAADELRILGVHNVANALAAALAARLAGGHVDAVREGLRSFAAPAHRLEPIAEVNEVLWINDSKATNIASTRVAVHSMERPVVLLLGGRHKGEPYSQLLPDLAERTRAIVAFGEAAPQVQADLGEHLPVHRVAGGLDEVVRRAASLARPGDAVLLSPACSSFDMFANFEERGRRFAELVREESS